MSLVHEALQKAEREKQRKLGVAPSAPASTAQPTQAAPVHPSAVAPAVAPAPREAAAPELSSGGEQSREANHFLLPALIGCVAIVAIIAIVFLVSNASSVLRQSRESSPAATTAAVAPVATAPVPALNPPVATPSPAPPPVSPPAQATPSPAVPPPTPPPADDSKYKLSGIMKDPDGKYVAVLNERVAYEGNYIDGATVEKIEPDRVTIDVKGQKAVLRLR